MLTTASRSADARTRAFTVAALALIVLLAALLRLDALVGRYGTLDHPRLARFSTHTLASIGATLRPAGVAWVPVPHPYLGGDPINYLYFGRGMQTFYQPHVREPGFLALVRACSWALDGQDAAVSFASLIGSLLIVVGTYLLGATLISRPAGLAAALLMAVEYEMIGWSVDGWRDDTFSAAFVFTAWALLRLRDKPSFASAIVLGVTGGLACLTRLSALSFVIPPLAWIALDAGDERMARVRYGLLALGITTIVVLPYLVSCAMAFGDPFYAVNVHTGYYRFAEGLSDKAPMNVGAYLRLKFASHPIGTADVGFIGLFVWPFARKWNGLDVWLPGLATIAEAGALVGLAMWLFSPRGRLLLVILLSSLLPYAFTWNLGGGGEWRFTMHAYPIYVVAGMYAVASLARPWWRAPFRPLAWRAGVVCVLAIAGVVIYLAGPWWVAREAIARGEAVNIEASPRDRVFFRSGWSALRQDGAVVAHVSLAAQTTVHVPLPAKRAYEVVLRFDPAAPEAQRRVTILVNRQMLGTVLTSWDPQRVGSYRLTLPATSVHAGDNAVTLVPDTMVVARDAGARYTWMEPDARIGIRFWYLRVLD